MVCFSVLFQYSYFFNLRRKKNSMNTVQSLYGSIVYLYDSVHSEKPIITQVILLKSPTGIKNFSPTILFSSVTVV